MHWGAPAAWVVAFTIATTAVGLAPATAAAAPANHEPVCKPGVTAVEPGGSRSLLLRCNDLDGPAIPATIVVTGADHGTLGPVNHRHGAVRYTPEAGFTGTETLTVQASDGLLSSAPVQHEVRVTDEPQAPVCDTTPLKAIEGQGSFFPCTDPDQGDAVTVQVVDPAPLHGTTSAFADQISYDAGAYRGPDSITVRASDGTRLSEPTTIPIEVVGAGAPVCDDPGTIEVRTGKLRRLDIVCREDFSFWSAGQMTFEELEQPAHGTLRGDLYGRLSYAPDPGFTGTDRAVLRPMATTTRSGPPLELQFTVSNDGNTPPECFTWAAEPVRPGRATYAIGCDDLDDDPVTLRITDAPDKGTFTPAATNGFFGRYVPDPGTSGEDHITVVAGDGLEEAAPVTQRLDVVPASVNTAPTCFGFATTLLTEVWTSVPVGLSCLPDEEGDPLTNAFTSPLHGTLSQDDEGYWLYAAADGFVGTDVFSGTASDGSLTSKPATVRVDVRAPSAPKCAPREPRTVRTGVRTGLDVSCRTDVGLATHVVIDEPEHGTLTATQPYGHLSYESDPGYEGPDEFKVRASNGHGSDEVTQQITVDEDFNSAPTCGPLREAITRSAPVTIEVHCFDAELDPVTIAVADQPAHGTASEVVESKLTYTPAEGYVGRDAFTFAGTDDRGAASEEAVQKIVVRDAARNVAPFCAGAERWIDRGLSMYLSVDCFDPDGDALTTTIVEQPARGSVTLSPEGYLHYTAPDRFTGTDTFRVAANDGTLTSEPVTVRMVVTGERGVPTCSEIAFAATAGVAKTVELPCLPWGDGGPGMTIEIVEPPDHGTVGDVGSDRRVSYTPDAGFSGTDSFTFRAVEGTKAGEPVTATITVTKPDEPDGGTPPPTRPKPKPTLRPGTTPPQPGTAPGALLQQPSAASQLALPFGLRLAAPSSLIREALGARARRVLSGRLGGVGAYAPATRIRFKGRSVPLLALTCPRPSCSVTARPTLELGGRRRLRLPTQRIFFGADRPGIVVLRLNAKQRRALRRARRAAVRVQLATGRRSGTVRLGVR